MTISASERRQQTIIGMLTVAIIAVLLVVCGVALYRGMSVNRSATTDVPQSEQAAHDALRKIKVKPSLADDKGGILVSKNGYGSKIDGVPTVGMYLEPLCPGCALVSRTLDPTIKSMLDAGQINLDLHFMTFQDYKSGDEYSTRAFNAAVTIAQQDPDPDHLLGYLMNIYAQDFQPGELSEYRSVTDDQLKQQALDAGVDKTTADAAFDGRYRYRAWLKAADDYTILRPELYAPGKNGFSTPTVMINDRRWQMDGSDLKDSFLTAVGLGENEVGNPTVKPKN
ncbi:thioredoxin domain-containing protein [Bifidobacterium sp. 82T10]|uniref:Thioredoxin domain-containing protein n=1 Tax=Bifidobacterium miconis TaxID=2834435 RepID=A0ABS6WEZ0_9BIFI|nr:thioredoxin domain-containing protein [Bifidobacterium miconis]MBW3092585.1 thioredoxin domain-containing protein [Bifidobacterium miconis]